MHAQQQLLATIGKTASTINTEEEETQGYDK